MRRETASRPCINPPLANGLKQHVRAGFTLIELLVVLVVMGIALSLIVVQLLPDERAILREEAQRLALLMENASLEARANGRSLAWSGEKNYYRFWQKNEYAEWVQLESDQAFRARTLPEGISIASVRVEDQTLPTGTYLVLSAHAFALPFQIRLASRHVHANILGRSTGRVVVEIVDVE